MTVFTFTPAKFAILLVASVGVALCTTNRPLAPHTSYRADLLGPYPASQAVGQDNGTLTSSLYLEAAYTPAPPKPISGRPGTSTPQPTTPPVSHRNNYPPMAR